MNHVPGLRKGVTEEEFEAQKQKDDKSLSTLKKARKQIESDAQILANRIALLKQEELKSWKKIEETKKKAQEVYLLKKKNEEKIREKQLKEVDNKEHMKDSQFASVELRKNKQQERDSIRDAIVQQKRDEMLAIRRQKEKNAAKKKEYQTKILIENQTKHNSIRQQETIGNLRKKEYLESKMERFRMEQDRKVIQEEEFKHRKEMEVLNMEKLEMELIKKLQHTQLLQKAAYEELETALANPVDDYAKKYGNEGFPTLNEDLGPNMRNSQTKFSMNQDNGDFEDSNNLSESKSSKRNVGGQPHRAAEEYSSPDKRINVEESSEKSTPIGEVKKQEDNNSLKIDTRDKAKEVITTPKSTQSKSKEQITPKNSQRNEKSNVTPKNTKKNE
jgi:hypothetical protein